MSKLVANAAVALSMMLSASVSAPAWAGKASDQKCSEAKQKQAARRPAPAAKAKANQGAMLVEQRKFDVQILSFGP